MERAPKEKKHTNHRSRFKDSEENEPKSDNIHDGEHSSGDSETIWDSTSEDDTEEVPWWEESRNRLNAELEGKTPEEMAEYIRNELEPLRKQYGLE
jgi:hypothetical protein